MLDDFTRKFLRSLGDQPDLADLKVAEARRADAQLALLLPPGPDVASVETIKLARSPVRLYAPHGVVAGIIVYVHGGGWVVGELEEYDTLARTLACETGCAVVLAGYRKAPEDPFPAGLHDVWAALKWVDVRRVEIAGSGVPLIVAGDSAGGNLAAVVAQWARDRGGPDLALQLLIYPITDYSFSTRSYLDPANGMALTKRTMEWFWDHYISNPDDRFHPDASPLRAAELAGLAPAVIVTAQHDVLRDEGIAYAERLAGDGVAVVHRDFAGQIHGFFTLTGFSPAAREAMSFVAQAIREELNDECREHVRRDQRGPRIGQLPIGG
jgi:acetyl esterase